MLNYLPWSLNVMQIYFDFLLHNCCSAVKCGNVSIAYSNTAEISGVYNDEWTVVCDDGYVTTTNVTAYNITCDSREDAEDDTDTQDTTGGGWWFGLQECRRKCNL